MSRPVKSLKKIKESENLDGFAYVDKNSYKIYVNVEKLWKEARGRTINDNNAVNSFACLFSKTHTHELLHFLIGQRRRKSRKYDYGEEKAIYRLLRDPWTKSISKFYEPLRNR